MKAIVQGKPEIKLEKKGDSLFIENTEQVFDLKELKPGTWHLLLNGASYTIEILSRDPSQKHFSFRLNGKKTGVILRDRFDDLLKELGMDSAAAQKTGHLKAPMPGLVVDIPVKEGQRINKGDTLVVLEAMKMENSLKAAADATVRKVLVQKGQAVEKNVVLVELD